MTGILFSLLAASGFAATAVFARTALQNAASVASLLLTTDALVSDLPEKKEEGAQAGMGHSH